MKVTDIIISLILGRILGFLLSDFLGAMGIRLGFYYMVILWILLPFIVLSMVWFAGIIGRRFLFIFQGTKHVLVGAVATVIDLKIFDLLSWIFSSFLFSHILVFKAISFLFSTGAKYIGNKYWAFAKHQKENLQEEIINFLFITLVGLVIDTGSFYFLTTFVHPLFGMPAALWIKSSIIMAAIAAALWNFLGYKFLVFKK